ncbi:MAG: polysaccharide deacetylase family protein [Janthinobacterium lividum]
MARIVLKVDVDTLRGTREGVPTLLRLLDRAGVRATFLFSLGPDHTGRALKRVFRPGFLKKVSRTSVVEHYGLRTLMYGVLLPGPDIGRRAAATLRSARDAGCETGVHTWDHIAWQDHVRVRDAEWTRRQMQRSFARYAEVFGAAPVTHGAAGWQMNRYAFEQLDLNGIRYASDGRGRAPYRLSIDGRPLAHIQMPTTLPTIDELIGVGDIRADNVADHLLSLTSERASSAKAGSGGDRDQVFTLHAELEGGKLAPAFARLLDGWRAQGHTLLTMGDYHATLDTAALPVQALHWGSVAGRSGQLIVQS